MDHIITFIIACILIEATPGPNMGYLAIISAQKGRKVGFATVLGIFSGLLSMGILAVLGVGTLIANSEVAYQTLRVLGIGYMFFLAYDGWRGEAIEDNMDTPLSQSYRRYFMRGFITNILNPKAAIFFVTLLPTFIVTNEKFHFYYIMLTVIFVMIATLIHMLIVILSSQMQSFLNHSRREKYVRRALSILLAFIAVWFAWSTQITE